MNENKNENIALDDVDICPHCGTIIGMFKNHNCFMKHLHEQMETKRKRKKHHK
jgi:hypothetical protein